MKHQKAIPEKLVLQIYKRENTHLNTAIVQLITGAFFFGMRYCKYSTTPKVEDKRTRILQKGDIRFFRKRCELSHVIEILSMTNKVSPTFYTQKNATVTQWRTTKTLCLVRIWEKIIIRLYSYPGTTRAYDPDF